MVIGCLPTKNNPIKPWSSTQFYLSGEWEKTNFNNIEKGLYIRPYRNQSEKSPHQLTTITAKGNFLAFICPQIHQYANIPVGGACST